MPGSLQAIVLAAGFGRRMRPLSDTCHKALLPVGGTTILARIVDSLHRIGVDDITVVTGYRADDVSSYLLDRYPGHRFSFVANERYAETNNIVSLSLALHHMALDRDVVLVECDLLFDPALLDRLAGPDRGNIALLDHYRTGMDGTVVSVAGGMVGQVFPPHVQGADFSYANKYKTLNIYRFDHEFCARTLRPLVDVYANQIDANSYYELVLGMLANVPAQRIAAEVVDGDLWAEVDDPNDLAVARFHFQPEQRAEILDRTFGGHWNLEVEDFAFMRNVHFPTEAMLAAMRHALPALLAGYGSTQAVLNEKLSYFVGCDPARLQVLHGATQAFPILRDRLAGRTVALPTPTFGEFPRMFPGALTYPDAPGLDLATLDRVAPQADVTVVVNPNNPTGTTVPPAELHALARRHPERLFLVDESFIEFSGHASLVGLLEQEPLANVIVLVSLSKTLGVPGLRIGYLFSCDAEFIAAVGAALPIWNLSAPAEYFLELVLKFRVELAASIAQTVTDRDELFAELERVPGVAEIYPSGGDFLLVRLALPAAAGARLRASLLAGPVIDVKDVSARFGDGAARLRVGVRSGPENHRFVEALAAALERETR